MQTNLSGQSKPDLNGGTIMKDRKNTFARLAVVMLLTVSLLCTGCGTKEPAPKETQEKSLALLLSQEDEFLMDLKACIESEVAKQGYALHYYTAEGDPKTQLEQVHEVLASGVDTLIVNLTNDETGERIADIVGDANVVFVNRAPTNKAILNEQMVFVGMDEAQCGALQGEALAQYFWQEKQGTEIRYLLFQGVPKLENTNERSNNALQGLMNVGFTPVAAAEFQVCNFYRDRAYEAMNNLLADNVIYDCIICNNDAMALGVIDALEAVGKDPAEVPIVGIDNTADGAAALQAGKLYMTVDQNAQMQAEFAVAAAINLNEGRAFDSKIYQPLDANGQTKPYTIRIPVSAVTAYPTESKK